MCATSNTRLQGTPPFCAVVVVVVDTLHIAPATVVNLEHSYTPSRVIAPSCQQVDRSVPIGDKRTMCRSQPKMLLIALYAVCTFIPTHAAEAKLRFELLNVTIANQEAQLGAVSHLQESPDHLQLPIELIMERTLEKGTLRFDRRRNNMRPPLLVVQVQPFTTSICPCQRAWNAPCCELWPR